MAQVALFWRFWTLLRSVWNLASDRNIGLISAGVAFFGMFAIFPGIGAVISLFGLLADPTIVSEQLLLMEDIIPPETLAILNSQADRLLAARNDTLGWATFVSIGLAVWAARAGVAGLMGGLNEIAGCQPRNGFKQAFVALNLTMCLVVLAIVAMGAVIVAPLVVAIFPFQQSSADLIEGIRWIVAFCVLYAALSLLYRFGPNQRGARLRWLTVGAVTVIVLWTAASMGLSYYLTNFASYNEVYGSIGAVIGMLLWLYVTAYLILLGAALNLRVHGGVSV